MTEATLHQVRAALEVARIVDSAGNPTGDVRDAYRHLLTLGEHTSESLVAGERLLIELGLLVETDGRLRPSAALQVVARVEGDAAEDALRARVQAANDQELRERIGAAGEVAVVAACRRELEQFGHHELATRVQQVSLVNDTLGYDVYAPSIAGPSRRLEVKTTTRLAPGIFSFFLSRNEYEVGRREPDAWALVTCSWDKLGDAQVIGWCRASALTPYLPSDGNGHWTEAKVRIPRARLFGDVPPAA